MKRNSMFPPRCRMSACMNIEVNSVFQWSCQRSGTSA